MVAERNRNGCPEWSQPVLQHSSTPPLQFLENMAAGHPQFGFPTFPPKGRSTYIRAVRLVMFSLSSPFVASVVGNVVDKARDKACDKEPVDGYPATAGLRFAQPSLRRGLDDYGLRLLTLAVLNQH